MVVFPPFRVDLEQERLWSGGKELPLRRKPFAILRFLLAHPRRLVTYDELRAHVWGGTVVSESAVRTHLHELRQALGEGVIETVIGRGYRFIADLADEAVAPTQPTARGSSPSLVVGRDAELAQLRAALERARGGQRQLCLVTGEPGIGKTTLVEAFLDEVDQAGVLATRGQCVEQYGSPEAYLAVIELFVRLGQSVDGDRVRATLVRYAPTFVAQVPHLIPADQLDDVTRRAGGGSDARQVRELAEAIEALCDQQPLIVVLEDLQWSDVATIDLVNALHQRRERAKLLVIATARRAETQTTTHPLNRVARDLVARRGATAIPLDRIAVGEVAQLVDRRFPAHEFPPGFVDIVDRITAGTPIFVTSLLDDLARREMVTDRDGPWRFTVSLDELAAHRPDGVRQLIDIQLDRLAPAEQTLLECAAVVGLEFAPTIIARALDRPDEALDDLCDSLTRRGLFVRRAGIGELPDGTGVTRYAFTHGLVLEVCVTRGTLARRQRWHRAIADTLERVHGTHAADIAHVLAGHFENGQDLARAVRYYTLAGDRNAQRFASPDAMRMYQRARELLARMPANRDRDTIELALLGPLSQATIRASRDATREPIAMFLRMGELARTLGDTPALCHSLANLSFRYSILAEYKQANAVGDELAAHTEALPPPLLAFQKIARFMGTVFSHDIVDSLAVVAELVGSGGTSLGATDRQIVMLLYQSVLHWVVGRADSGIADIELAIELARQIGDPYALGASLTNLSRAKIWRGEPAAAVREPAERVLAIPEASVWHNQCRINVAWAESRSGPLDHARCLALVDEFHDRSARFPMGITLIGVSLAGVLRASHLDREALALVEQMLAFVRDRGESIFLSEYLRLRGELLESTDPAAALALFTEAHAAARSIRAAALELRTALALARVRPADRELVRDVLARITGGATTSDVIAARALLESP